VDEEMFCTQLQCVFPAERQTHRNPVKSSKKPFISGVFLLSSTSVDSSGGGQQIPFHSPEASATRRNLGRMARRLVALKGERDQRQRDLKEAV
jgi:hypothetical protein